MPFPYSLSFTLAAEESSAPVVSYTPAPGSRIARDQTIRIGIVDENEIEFASVVIEVEYPSGYRETIHRDETWWPAFSESEFAVLETIDGSTALRFTVRRNRPWPAAPTFRVSVADSLGNVEPLG